MYRTQRIPQTLTAAQYDALLATTGKQAATLRDHTLYTLALGTALREHELVALDVADVRGVDRIALRTYKRSNPDERRQVVMLPAHLQAAAKRFVAWKERRGESTAADAPLFVSRNGKRLSTRMVRHGFGVWLAAAGIPVAGLTFHSLRHTACTMFYQEAGDLAATQRFARHASIESTVIYTHVSLETVAATVGRGRLGARK